MKKSAATGIYLFSLPLKGKVANINKGVESERLFHDFIITQRQKIENFEKIFKMKIKVGAKNNFATDKDSLKGLVTTLVNDISARNEAERGVFNSVTLLSEVSKRIKNINKISTDLIKILEKVGEKNYSPSTIWNKLCNILSEFISLEKYLEKLITTIKKK